MLTAWLMMLAAGVRLADVAAVPAWLMWQAYHVFVFVWWLVLAFVWRRWR